ncbi:MAG: hypothetical protein JNK47_03350 [Mesorhizobium sp.]|nr:hypothetical protein [Mesorhizobium sp.]MBL8576238.1 hypothetical protein [Mesorhizobium sp.]
MSAKAELSEDNRHPRGLGPRLRSRGRDAAAWAFGDQILSSATNFFMLVLLASGLGASLFGSFAVGWMGILFSLSLQMAMVTAPTITHRPKVHHRRHQNYDRAVLEHTFVLAFGAALVLTGALALWVILIESRAFAPIEFAAFFLAVLASGLHEQLRRQAFVRETPIQAVILNFGRSTLLIGALCICRIMQFPLTLTHAYLFVAVACAAPLAYALLSGIGTTTRQIRRHVARRHLPTSFRLGVMTATEYIALNLPLLSLGVFGSSSALGQIRALGSISQIIQILPRSLETVLPHRLRAAFLDRRFEFTQFITIFAISSGILLHLIILAIFILYHEFIVNYFFGADFSSSSRLLPIFAGVSLLSYIFSIQRSIFIAANNPKLAVKARLYSMYASVVLSLSIVPFAQQAGTAIALLLVELAVVVAGYQALWIAFGKDDSNR